MTKTGSPGKSSAHWATVLCGGFVVLCVVLVLTLLAIVPASPVTNPAAGNIPSTAGQGAAGQEHLTEVSGPSDPDEIADSSHSGGFDQPTSSLPGTGDHAFRIEIPGVISEGLAFDVNGLALLFALAGSVPWLLSFLFSIPYFRAEHDHGSHAKSGGTAGPGNAATFYTAFGLSLLFTLAVFFAADLFTAFFAFEALGLASYLLVRHEGTPESEDASDLYLYMSLAGGLLLLAGIMILKAETGSTEYVALSKLHGSSLSAAVLLVISGFGVKAGLIGLHIWLPRAHPVAPSPASAVLSGVMIKVGAFGILRTVLAAGQFDLGGLDLSTVVAFVGLANMWWGGFSALTAGNLKRVMAYSSVSQMGYILLGISQVTAHGHGALLGLSGVLYHVLNHGLFKSLLFLVAGALLVEEGSSDLSQLRGSLRKHKWALAGFVTGFLAITGVPGLNGFVSKTLVHDSLLVASEHRGGIWRFVEVGFTLGSALTALYFLRTFLILCGRREDESRPAHRTHSKLAGPWVPVTFTIFMILIATIGLFPGFYLRFALESGLIFGGIEHEGLEELAAFHYFTWDTVKPVVIGFIEALIVYMALRKFLDEAHADPPLTITRLFKTAGRAVAMTGRFVDSVSDHLYYYLAVVSHRTVVFGAILEFAAQGAYHALSSSVLRVTRFLEAADRDADRAVVTLNRTIELIAHFLGKVEEEDEHLVEVLGRRSHSVAEAALTEEKVVGNIYLTAGRAGENFLGLSDRIEHEAEREYANGWRYARSAINRTAKAALRLRPTAPDRFWTIHPEQRERAAILIIGATIALVAITAIMLVLVA